MLRRAALQPGGGGRQPHEADVHRHEAPVPAPLPPGADRGDDRIDGGRREDRALTGGPDAAKYNIGKGTARRAVPFPMFPRPRRSAYAGIRASRAPWPPCPRAKPLLSVTDL